MWRILLSGRAHIVFDFHRQVDGLGETRPGRHEIGTTKEGIGLAGAGYAWATTAPWPT